MRLTDAINYALQSLKVGDHVDGEVIRAWIMQNYPDFTYNFNDFYPTLDYVRSLRKNGGNCHFDHIENCP